MSGASPRRSGFGMVEGIGLGFRIAFVATLLLAVGWAVGNLRQVPADSRAVVERFGQIVRVRDAGLMLAWPIPIERITLVPAWDRQIALKMLVPTNSGPSQETDFEVHQPDDLVSLRRQPDAWNGEYFLTGDDSVVQFEATLYYRVTDPAAYVLERDHVEPALQRLYRASAVAIAANHNLDDFLVARPEDANLSAGADAANRREALRGDMVMAINRRLVALRRSGASLGVQATRIDIVALLPPLAKQAFDDVLTAAQIADQTVAAARTDAAHTMQEAQRAHDRALAEATATAEEEVRQAEADTADIHDLHAELTPANRGSLLEQYYRDRISVILHKIGHVTTVDMRGGQPIIIPGPGQ
jgi:modulator of FtsH protease HflK